MGRSCTSTVDCSCRSNMTEPKRRAQDLPRPPSISATVARDGLAANGRGLAPLCLDVKGALLTPGNDNGQRTRRDAALICHGKHDRVVAGRALDRPATGLSKPVSLLIGRPC